MYLFTKRSWPWMNRLIWGSYDKNEILQKITPTYDEFGLLICPYPTMVLKLRLKVPICEWRARIALLWEIILPQAEAPKIAGFGLLMKTKFGILRSIRPANKKTPMKLFFTFHESDALGVVRVIMFVITCEKSWGWGCRQPTWELLASFWMYDGLPMMKSPLFDPFRTH